MINNVSYIFVIEGEYQSRKNLLATLQGSDKLYQYLILQNYLKSDGGNSIAFDFVGLISFDNLIVCVLPKYYKGHQCTTENLLSDFTTIIKVLKKVGHSDSIPDSKNISNNELVNLSEFVFADRFLKDYLDYGIFNKNTTSIFLNKDGEVNWGLTVNDLDPIFSKGRPIYHDVFVNGEITEEFNLITELHKWVIKYCLKKFGRILDYNFHFTADCVNHISDLGSIEFIKRSLDKELHINFIDREILLVKRLRSFIDNLKNDNSDNFSLYGTAYFQVIWEKACSAVFFNQINLFQSTIPFPRWNNLQGSYVEKDTLRPDIISTLAIDEGKFFIFDAKYYNVTYYSIPNFSVNSNPGISDVSKQFLYANAFKDVQFGSKYNGFLFPKLMPVFFELFGFVTLSLFEDLVIYNIYLSPKEVFDGFLKNTRVGQQALESIADKMEETKPQ